MEQWLDYEKVTVPNSGVMDQMTQNAALTSARIGVQIACGNFDIIYDWEPAYKVCACM